MAGPVRHEKKAGGGSGRPERVSQKRKPTDLPSRQLAKSKVPKVSQRVTAPLVESRDGHSDDEEHNWEAQLEDNQFDADVMQLDQSNQNDGSTRPHGSKEARSAQRDLLVERKGNRPHADQLMKLKKLWNRLRVKEMKEPERRQLIFQMLEILVQPSTKSKPDKKGSDKGKRKPTSTTETMMAQLARRHDASRIIQALIKYGNSKERAVIAEELRGVYVELSCQKFSKFMVSKLLRYCPQKRGDILREFHGKVRSLIKHREASAVLEDAFALWANAKQRAALVEEFYGKEYALFKDADANPRENKEPAELNTLSRLIGRDLTKKAAVMTSIKESLAQCADKGTIGLSIVHRPLLEYLLQCSDDDISEKRRNDMFEVIGENLAEIVHTKDGSAAAMQFLLYGNAKTRKEMIKTLKPFVARIARDEYGQMTLLRAFDVVDDTVLVNKQLIQPFLQSETLLDLIKDKYGRRTLLYLLCGRTASGMYLSGDAMLQLSSGDAVRSKTSKKDAATRSDELRLAVLPQLLKVIEEHGEVLMRDSLASQVCTETILHARAVASLQGLLNRAQEALLRPFQAPYTPKAPSEDSSDSVHIITLTPAARALKTLLQGGHYDTKTQSVNIIGRDSSAQSRCRQETLAFALLFFERCRENAETFALGDGAFVISELILQLRAGSSQDRNGSSSAARELSDILSGIEQELAAASEAGRFKGTRLVLQTLRQHAGSVGGD